MFSLCTTFTILNYTHYWLMGSGMFLGAIIGITIDRIDWIKKNEFYK